MSDLNETPHLSSRVQSMQRYILERLSKRQQTSSEEEPLSRKTRRILRCCTKGYALQALFDAQAISVFLWCLTPLICVGMEDSSRSRRVRALNLYGAAFSKRPIGSYPTMSESTDRNEQCFVMFHEFVGRSRSDKSIMH